MKMKTAIALLMAFLCLPLLAQTKPETTIKIPTLSQEDETDVLRMQRDLARIQGAISNLNAQYASCKSMVDQYGDQNSAQFKQFKQAQDKIQELTKQLDDKYKALQKPGFTFDQNNLSYTPAMAGPPLPVQPQPKTEGAQK